MFIFFTHLIEALVHQIDQCRRINIRVHLHSPVSLDYLHTEVQRVLMDTNSKRINSDRKKLLFLSNANNYNYL